MRSMSKKNIGIEVNAEVLKKLRDSGLKIGKVEDKCEKI